jgi:ABC-type dipeptide/oligopeptide/nickel transport system permease component
MEFEVYFKFFSILILVAGTVGNVLLIYIILKEKELREKTANHFILAISFVNIFWANYPLQFFFVVSLKVFQRILVQNFFS